MKILYVMDDGESGLCTLEHVVTEARKCPADLVLLDVIDTLPPAVVMGHGQHLPGQVKNSVLQDRLSRLGSFIMTNGYDDGALRARVLFGNRAREISRTAAEGDFDLVIKHPEPGATDSTLVHHGPCPVLLYEDDTQLSADSILESLSRPLPRQQQVVA